MSHENDKRQIVKSSAIVGGSSFLTILIGLIKVKALAVLLGPTGIGLMGILTTIMATGTTFFGMGLSTSGVRELALNYKNIDKLELVRKALFSANFLLGLLAIVVTFIFKSEFSEWFFKSDDYQLSICVISVGVFFSLISSSQTTLLQGLRKITELAKVKVLGALVSSLLGLLIIFKFGTVALPFFVISLPIFTFVVALFYCRKLPQVATFSTDFKQLKQQWQSLFTLGTSFMLIGLMGVGCQLLVRYILNQELGVESVGYFQASWAISMTYISFVLGAMAADYYPRLTQQINDVSEANRLVNEQTEVSIIFATPVLFAMLSFAPLIIHLLYSNEFNDSIEILRWQIFGDVFKVISFPLGFIILAKGYKNLFFCTELLWNISYVLFVYLGIHYYGIEVTGYAFAISYVILLVTIYSAVRKINYFRWTGKNVQLILKIIIPTVVLLIMSYFSFLITILLGILFSCISSFYAIKMISELSENSNKLINIFEKCKSRFSIKN